jgi:hypothetical protein
MFFSQQALNEMSEARRAIGGKYEGLLMKYVLLPLKDATAKEYATQGFPRALGRDGSLHSQRVHDAPAGKARDTFEDAAI